MNSPATTVILAIASTIAIAAITAPAALAKGTITQKEFLKVKAKYEAAKKAVRDAKPKDSKAKFEEDLFDTAVRAVNEAKADKKKVDNDPKSTKEDKDIAQIILDDANDVAGANYPGKKGGDPNYRALLKRLRYAEHFYDEALDKKRIYPKKFTNLTQPEPTTTSMDGIFRETGDNTGIFSRLGGRSVASQSAHNAAAIAVRANRPIHGTRCRY